MDVARVGLVLSDIDGTMLPFGRTSVSSRTLAAIHAALEAGLHVGPASGRGFSHIPASFGGDAACSATCLATNGMQVFLDGRLIYQALLPREPLVRVAEALGDVAHAGLICFEDGMPLLVEGDVSDLEQSFPLYARESRRVDEVPAHDIEKANVFVAGDLEQTRAVLEMLEAAVPGIGFNLPMPAFINLTPVGWSKADGIDVLCSALGIELSQVVVFGDGGNDVEMLAHVPNSVAVANAVPEAAQAARWHAGRCEDDAVAQVLEGIVAGVWPLDS